MTPGPLVWTHCHCWDDCLGPCCWCGRNDDEDETTPYVACTPHQDGPCEATIQARAQLGDRQLPGLIRPPVVP